MTTNSYEYDQGTQYAAGLPTADPAEVPTMEREFDGTSSMTSVAHGGNEAATTSSNFFNLPEISQLDINAIDMTSFDDDTKAAFALLSGLGRAEAQDDATTREIALVLSDVFVERRDARAQRDEQRVWSARTILDAQVAKNQAAVSAETAQQRYERTRREKLGIEEDIHADFEHIRILRVEKKSLCSERDSLQTEYDGLRVRARELALGTNDDGQEVIPLLDQERVIYIQNGKGFGALMGTDSGDYTPNSRAEQLRAAAVIEQVYLTHHETQLAKLREQIRVLDAQIAEVEQAQSEKTASKNLIQERLNKTYTESDTQQGMFEHATNRLEEQIMKAQLIPRPPAENLLEQTQRELAARLGERAAQGIVEISSTPVPRPLVSGQAAKEITDGGMFRNKRRIVISVPAARSDQ